MCLRYIRELYVHQIATHCSPNHPPPQIPVTVYYEALCPDSQAFITNQLYPVMQSPLAKNVALKLVPFGKSNVSTHTHSV